MPTVSNVQLQIQKTPLQQAPTAARKVTVTYQLGFSQPEIDARASFQVRVSLLSFDNNTLPVTTFGLTAAPGLVSRTETHTFQRRQLDEEPDFEIIIDSQGHPHRVPSEMPDAWRARVMATYVPEPVFGNATSVSTSVNGSWGALGDD